MARDTGTAAAEDAFAAYSARESGTAARSEAPATALGSGTRTAAPGVSTVGVCFLVTGVEKPPLSSFTPVPAALPLTVACSPAVSFAAFMAAAAAWGES